MINRASLSKTLDAVSEVLSEQRKLPSGERKPIAKWIAARQGRKGAYGDTFAGFPAERRKGIVLFTGERVTSASARHILGEEASRVLRLLDVQDPKIQSALERADAGLMKCLARAALDPRNSNP